MHVLAAADAERTNVFGELIDFRLSHFESHTTFLVLSACLKGVSTCVRNPDRRVDPGRSKLFSQ
jgi:hypothetical protein